jgi:surface polysaccharide O-acyltransferase-like enzyme
MMSRNAWLVAVIAIALLAVVVLHLTGVVGPG